MSRSRISLRPFRLSDAALIIRLLNDPDFIRHVGDRNVRTIADARRYLALGPMESHVCHGFGLDCMVLVETGEAIGMCGLSKRRQLEDPDVGYALLPEFRGQGLVAEAIGLVLVHARTVLGLERLAAVVQEGNSASVRALERNGFVSAGTIRLRDDAPELLYFLRDIRPQ